MSEISREELSAFAEAHAKSAVALERVTDALEVITQKQDKIIDKMTNGVSEAIINGVTNNYDNTHKETVASLNRIEGMQKDILEAINSKVPTSLDEKLKNSTIARDIEHTKWFVAIVGIVVIIAMVILRLLGVGLESKNISTQTQVLQHMLQDHMKQTGDVITKIPGG
jgi:hypothetical protein